MIEQMGYVICDLDGCLSDDRWRRHLLPRGSVKTQEAYDEYHSHAGKDDVVPGTLNSIRYDAYDEHGVQRAKLLFVTARPDSLATRAATMLWLNQNLTLRSTVGLPEYVLLMRPTDNLHTSPVCKMMLLTNYFNEQHLAGAAHGWQRVVSAYDDRADVLAAYPLPEGARHLVTLQDPQAGSHSVPEVLRAMAQTFEDRNKVYGSNYLRVAPIIRALWPDGVPSELVTEDRWHLFELIVVKLTRFAISGLTHIDSIHDAAVYAAMIESDLHQ